MRTLKKASVCQGAPGDGRLLTLRIRLSYNDVHNSIQKAALKIKEEFGESRLHKVVSTGLNNDSRQWAGKASSCLLCADGAGQAKIGV